MAGPVIPGGVQWRNRVNSTQDEAHGLGAAGAPHGTTVAARIQTGGRGTRGRGWDSREGGLWLSVLCRPEGDGPHEAVSLRVGVALARLLDAILPRERRISLKWPNDLYLGELKVGGILTEARWQGDSLGWMVIGVGINVSNEIPPEFAAVATRLLDAGVAALPEELAEPVALTVAQAAERAMSLTDAEVRAFDARDWLRGRALNLPEQGVAEGITPTGRLKVRTIAGPVAEVLGSVQLAEPG